MSKFEVFLDGKGVKNKKKEAKVKNDHAGEDDFDSL